MKKLLLSTVATVPAVENKDANHKHAFLKSFRQMHKNASRCSKDDLAQFFFQVQKAKCEKNVLFLKRFLMPDIYQKFHAFVTECEQDALSLEINCVKFKSFMIHSPDSPSTGEQSIYLLLEYSLQECWSELKSNFKKEQFHDVTEIWELLYSKNENKFYLYWVYDLGEISEAEMDYLFETLKAA